MRGFFSIFGLMTRTNKLSKLNDSDEAALAKLSRKERAVAVSGKPDQQDVNDLTLLFETYDKVTGGRLRKMANDARLERALNNRDGRIESVDTAEKLAFWMPKDLQEEMEKYFPSVWTNKDHLRWFLKKFPMFRK